MRIAVISVSAQSPKIPDYVHALAKGMASMGHQVDILDARTEEGFRLPAYNYIVVSAEAVSLFSGKMPEALSKFLSLSNITGKKGAAFLKKKGPFTTKALVNLMRAMEKEGMLVNWSEIILNAPHAESLGKRIGA
ncbi:MAG: hypothetical protein LBC51_04955 [Treponema sp.]|jgi:menaquinone-dependent protoporphyrinogen IX oxidase|nr:hypothetical protein [Treponema sp.]